MRKKNIIKEMKKLLKLYDEKEKLKEELNELWKERNKLENKQLLILFGSIGLFLLGIIIGPALLASEEGGFEHKILGSFSLGFSVGILYLFIAQVEFESLEEQIKEIDEKEIEVVEKKIEKINKVLK